MTLWRWCSGWALGLGLGVWAAPFSHAQTACSPPPAGAQLLSEGPVQVAWLAVPAPVVGRPFVLQVVVCPADAELVRVDAQMPEHRHGMNYRPSLKHLGQGRWRVEGLLWHMSGRWDLSLDVRHQDKQQRLMQSVLLP
jgi:hypothetical protein